MKMSLREDMEALDAAQARGPNNAKFHIYAEDAATMMSPNEYARVKSEEAAARVAYSPWPSDPSAQPIYSTYDWLTARGE